MQKDITKIVSLISCVKTKRKGICEAKDMYISPLFRYMYRYAKKRSNKIYILSAKYGVLEENTIIRNYNKTLNAATEQEKKEWSKNVMQILANKEDFATTKFILLGGNNYFKYLTFPIAVNPLKGLSLGYRLKYLKKN